MKIAIVFPANSSNVNLQNTDFPNFVVFDVDVTRYDSDNFSLAPGESRELDFWLRGDNCNLTGNYRIQTGFVNSTTNTVQNIIDKLFTDPFIECRLLSGSLTDLTTPPNQNTPPVIPNFPTCGWLPIGIPKVITVQNELVVDVSGIFCLSAQNHTFSGSRVISMLDGAVIRVNDGAHLIISDFEITGCTQMWQSIIVENGGRLSLNGCTIRDGIQAVRVESGGEISVSNCTFQDNLISIDIRNEIGWQGPSATATSIWRNTFEGMNNLKTPYQGQKPTAGIIAENIPLLNVFSHSSRPNVFRNMHSGIQSYYSNLSVREALFENIQPKNFSLGVAIYSLGGNGGNSLNVQGSAVHSPHFLNCHIGIRSSKNNLLIRDNIMVDVNLGIIVKASTNLFQTIIDNNIRARDIGIHLVGPKPISGNIENNIIRMDNPLSPITSYAIKGDLSSNFSTFSFWNIDNNSIGLVEARYGILMRSGDNTVIANNSVTTVGTVLERYKGISLDGHQNGVVQCNSVTGNVAGTNYKDATGIYIGESGNANVLCNTLNNTNLGIEVFGMSSNSRLRGNIYKKHKTGLLIKEDADIGKQFINTNFYGNQWISLNHVNDPIPNDDKLGAENENDDDSQSEFRVMTSNDPNNDLRLFMPSLSPSDLGWFFPDQGTNYQCSFNPCGYVFNGIIADEDDRLNKNIANNELVNTNFNASLRYTGARQLYRNISNSGAQVSPGGLFDVFLNNESNSTVGRFSDIESDISNLFSISQSQQNAMEQYWQNIQASTDSIWLIDSLLELTSDPQELENLNAEKVTLESNLINAQQNYQVIYEQLDQAKTAAIPQVLSDNQSISASAIYEINDQQVNDIFLQTVAVDQEPDSLQLLILKSIAYQCPLEGGEAVYHARAMIQNGEYDDEALCAAASQNSRKGERSESEFVITPNPTQGQVMLLLPSDVKSITVTNTVGQIIQRWDNNIFSDRWTMPDINLSAGLYYCTVETTSNKSTLAFVVIK